MIIAFNKLETFEEIILDTAKATAECQKDHTSKMCQDYCSSDANVDSCIPVVQKECSGIINAYCNCFRDMTLFDKFKDLSSNVIKANPFDYCKIMIDQKDGS